MKTFTYWNNKEKWHGELMFSCPAETILEADVLFEEATGFNPIKCSWIACTITVLE